MVEGIVTADAVVVAPSNPFVSIQPLLEVRGLRDALTETHAPRVAVSPIVGGEAVRGPAAEMMRTLGHEVSALGVARLYAGLVDGFLLDEVDGALAEPVEALGMRAFVTDTMMTSPQKRDALAGAVLAAADEVRTP